MLNRWPLNHALATLWEIGSHYRSDLDVRGLKMMRFSDSFLQGEFFVGREISWG